MAAEQTISAKAFLNLLAAFSSALLAWVFGSVIWENVKKIPVIETNVAVLIEKDRRHESDISENASDISKLFARYGNNKPALDGGIVFRPGAVPVLDSLRHINNVRSAVNGGCRSVDILLLDNSTGKITRLQTSWCGAYPSGDNGILNARIDVE